MAEFKVGDRVRVAKKVEEYDGKPIWVALMDHTVGSQVTVSGFSEISGAVQLQTPYGKFFYPPEALENA